MEYYSAIKRNKLLTHDNLYKFQGIYAEWGENKNPIPKGYIPYDSIYTTFLKKKFIEMETRLVIAKGLGGRGSRRKVRMVIKRATCGLLGVMELSVP